MVNKKKKSVASGEDLDDVARMLSPRSFTSNTLLSSPKTPSTGSAKPELKTSTLKTIPMPSPPPQALHVKLELRASKVNELHFVDFTYILFI
jgi:hypothetical protein